MTRPTIITNFPLRVDLVTTDCQADKNSFALKTIPKSVLRDTEHRRHSISGTLQELFDFDTEAKLPSNPKHL